MWGVSFRISFHPSKGVQYGELLSLLSNVFLCRDYKESRIWKPSLSMEFSVKAFFLILEGNHLPRDPFSLVWLGLAPSRVEVFCWLVVAAKVSTTEHLRRGLTLINISDVCVMCHKEGEIVNHLLLHCEVAVAVWSHVIRRCGLNWCCPKTMANWEDTSKEVSIIFGGFFF